MCPWRVAPHRRTSCTAKRPTAQIPLSGPQAPRQLVASQRHQLERISTPTGPSGAKTRVLQAALPRHQLPLLPLPRPAGDHAPTPTAATDSHEAWVSRGVSRGVSNPAAKRCAELPLARVRATRVTRKALASTSRCLRNLPGFRGSLTITDRDQRLGTRDGHGRGSWLRTTGGEATFERLPTHLPLLCPGVASPGPALAGRRELFIHSGRP